MLKITVTLDSKIVANMEQETGEARIKELVEEIKIKQHTNPAFFPVSEDFQEYLDLNNHAEISVLFGELMCLVNEFEGVQGMQKVLLEIRNYHNDKMTEAYQEFEDFREAFPEEYAKFRKGFKNVQK